MTCARVLVSESPRGCGWRRPSADGVGIYLVGPLFGRECGRLPFSLCECPTCGAGFAPARGWTWIQPSELFAWRLNVDPPACPGLPECSGCPCGPEPPEGSHGLLWIGSRFYATPDDFSREAHARGVSRKIAAVPHGFILGETWVYLAHIAGVVGEPGRPMLPAIVSAFRPVGIDLVVESIANVPEKADRIAERVGEDRCRVVQVEKATNGAQRKLFEESEGE